MKTSSRRHSALQHSNVLKRKAAELPLSLPSQSHCRSFEERKAAGKALRDQCARQLHAKWRAPRDRRDPVKILIESSAGRVSQLLPIRYGRMMVSPFAFYRGAAAVMASDLAPTPVSGINVQACGDCHLCNFGGFATPERKIVFDINDFDETSVAPWEWDVKRLVASFVVAGRANGFKEADCSRRKAKILEGNSRDDIYRSLREKNLPTDAGHVSLGTEYIAHNPTG
jgi:hypothetical protein